MFASPSWQCQHSRSARQHKKHSMSQDNKCVTTMHGWSNSFFCRSDLPQTLPWLAPSSHSQLHLDRLHCKHSCVKYRKLVNASLCIATAAGTHEQQNNTAALTGTSSFRDTAALVWTTLKGGANS